MTDDTRDPHKLCVACGLCCNGAWFGQGILEPDEIEQTRAAGLRVKTTANVAYLGLPCTKFQNGCCSIYEGWRPRVCERYTCALLNRFMAGEVSESEAMGHVASAKAMFDRVRAEAGDLEDGLISALRRLGGPSGRADESLPPLSAETTMDAVALKVYFNRHFLKPEDAG